jgi:CPA2 family monovalent cation:H+ antiporter-2
VVAAVLAGGGAGAIAGALAVALAAMAGIFTAALRWGDRLSGALARGSDEALLLSVFGLTLLVAGIAQRLQVSAAIGAFLVGLALSGPVQRRAAALIEPLRDLFAATFFLFFSFQIRPGSLFDVALPALALAVVTTGTKVVAGWVGASRAGVAPPGRMRAGTALVARGEFSIVIASLGTGTADGERLGALAAAYVLITAVAGPLLTKHYRVFLPRRRRAAAVASPDPHPGGPVPSASSEAGGPS